MYMQQLLQYLSIVHAVVFHNGCYGDNHTDLSIHSNYGSTQCRAGGGTFGLVRPTATKHYYEKTRNASFFLPHQLHTSLSHSLYTWVAEHLIICLV